MNHQIPKITIFGGEGIDNEPRTISMTPHRDACFNSCNKYGPSFFKIADKYLRGMCELFMKRKYFTCISNFQVRQALALRLSKRCNIWFDESLSFIVDAANSSISASVIVGNSS
jgi:hypothetical protein